MFRRLLNTIVLPHASANIKRYSGLGAATLFLTAKFSIAEDNKENEPRDVFNLFHKRIDEAKNGPTIKNLVFKGGGPKGIAYVGALEALEKQIGNDFVRIERVAGTSSGAITATLLSVGYTPKDTKELLSNTPFKNFILDNDPRTDNLVVKLANSATEKSNVKKYSKMFAFSIWHLGAAIRLGSKFFNYKGVCSGEVFRNWMDDAISAKVAEIEGVDKSQYKHLTFGRLKELQEQNPDKYKKLYIVGAMFDENNELNESRIYSADDDSMRDYIISDAVRVSMSIPYVFFPHSPYLNIAGERREVETTDEIRGGIDGGVLKNYPLDIFDYNKYLSEPFLNKAPDAKVVNPETLGFDLYTKKQISFWSWCTRTFNAVKDMNKRNAEPLAAGSDADEKLKRARSIAIDVVGVTLFDFDMPQPTIEKLQQSGRRSIEQYWASELQNLRLQQERCRKECEDSNKPIIKNFALSNLKSKVAYYQVPDEYTALLKNRLERKVPTSESQDNINKNQIEIFGMGGSGKSQLALYSAKQYFNFLLQEAWESGRLEGNNQAKPVVWFINAENKTTILTSLQNLAEKLECATCDDLAELSANIFTYLQNRPAYLLVFNNVVDRALIEYWQANMHASKNGTFLITSQNKIVADNNQNNCIYVDLDDGLSEGCDLVLMPEDIKANNELAKQGKLYLKPDGTYVSRFNGRVHTGSVREEANPGPGNTIDLNDLETKISNLDFKNQILNITSRRGHTPREKKASALVQKLCPRLKDQDISPLTKRLYNLPLALTVAATYLNNRKHEFLPVQGYIALLDNNQREELDKEQLKLAQTDPNLLAKKQTQEAAIRMSISNVVQDDQTQSLLILCSCLDAESITGELLKHLLDYEIDDAVEKLRSGSLIREIKFLSGERQVLAMHRFVQEVARRWYRNDLSMEWYARVLGKMHSLVNANLKSEFDYYQKRELLPHLEAIFASIKAKYGDDSDGYGAEIIQGHIDLGLLYKAVGYASQALVHYEKILPWIEKNKDTNKDLAIEYYIALGRAYQGGPGDFAKAKEYYEKAYALYSKEPSTKLAEMLNNLAMACRDLAVDTLKTEVQKRKENFEQALEHIQSAIKVVEELSGHKRDLIRYKINQCEIYRQLREFTRAQDSIDSAIADGQVEFEGESHRLLASAHFDLGKLYISKGKYEATNEEEAKKLFALARDNFIEAIKIGKDVYKEEPHPLVARHTDALGKAYIKLGDEAQACAAFRDAAKILQFSKGAQRQLKDKVNKHVAACKPNLAV